MISDDTDNEFKSLRELLVAIAGTGIYPGQVEILSQIEHVTVDHGPITMVELNVTGGIAASRVDGPLPVTAEVVDADEVSIGEILVWIAGGFISGLEFAWWSENPPRSLPSREFVRTKQKIE